MNSYAYTDYHHHQFDRPFLSPLPMPSPKSCWYPQRQDVQFGYSYSDMAVVSNLETRLDNTDRFVEVLRPPARPQPDPDPSYYQPHYSDAAMNTYLSGGYCQQPHYLNPNINGQPLNPYYWPEAYQQRAVDQLPVQPPYAGFNLPEPQPYPGTEPLGRPCDPVKQDLEPNLSLAALVSQLECLTADVEQLVSRMDANERSVGDPHAATSHCCTAAPLPAAATVTSLNLPQPAPPCSPDTSGDEGKLLDDDPLPPAVISQPGGPDTRPTSATDHVLLAVVPSAIQMKILEGVKRDCFSSSLGKSRVTEKFHNFDDIGFNDDANPIDGDVARMNHRPTSLDGDTRWIPPRKDTSCLSIVGSVDKLPVLTMNFGNHNGHPLMIFYGCDEGRCSNVRCVFDPGGDTSPKLRLLTLVVVSWFPP